MTKALVTIIFGIPCAILALLVLFTGATIIIGLACLSLWAYVVSQGVMAIYRAIKLI